MGVKVTEYVDVATAVTVLVPKANKKRPAPPSGTSNPGWMTNGTAGSLTFCS